MSDTLKKEEMLNPITGEPWDEWEITSLIGHLQNPENAPWLSGWSPVQIKLMLAGLSALRAKVRELEGKSHG